MRLARAPPPSRRHPWETVSTASWRKYPNEKAPHVTHVDYLWRHVDPETGCLHTARLITCKQAGPAFVASLLSGHDSNALAYEESVVDPRGRSFSVVSRNLTLSNLVDVEETCQYTPTADGKGTIFRQEAQISVRGWSHLKDYLEELCIRRFQANASRGKAALDEVIERICGETKGQLKDLLRDATGIPLQDMSGPEARSVSPSIAADAAAYLD